MSEEDQNPPWRPPPEGVNAPDINHFPASTPKHRLIFDQGSWEESVLGKSHEIFLESLENKLSTKNFLTRCNGEDFLFFRENPKFLNSMRSIIEGTLVLTAISGEKESRLSDLESEMQDALHEGSGGFTFCCDYVLKRNHLSYFLLILFSLFVGTLLGGVLSPDSAFLSLFLIPVGYATLILITEKMNLKSKRVKKLKKLINSSK